jgi:DNA-binding MurR/RpiR family transcriptional regulator
MTDYKTMGSLSSKLLAFISTTQVHDSNYDIAILLVRNFDRLKGMSIREVADLCYVSQASVSRFCRFLGFENFKEFKWYLDKEFSIKDDYSKQFYAILCNDEQMAMSTYRDEMIENIYTTISPENMEVMHDVVEVMKQTDHIAYFSHHFLWDIGRFFQSKMIMMGKFVELYMNFDAQLVSAQELTKDSLAIICTVGGSYITRYHMIWDAIVASGCKVLVITQNLSNAYLNNADYILRCGLSNRDDVGKYSAMMMTDYMVMLYLKKYSKK